MTIALHFETADSLFALDFASLGVTTFDVLTFRCFIMFHSVYSARPRVCAGAGRRVDVDDMLVKVHNTVATGDAAGQGPLIDGRSCATTGTHGNMLFSNLVQNYQFLRDNMFTVWQMETTPTYRLAGGITSGSDQSAVIVDELVKCTAFSEEAALPIAASQEETLQALRSLKLQGYTAEASSGWYLTASALPRIEFCRRLGAFGDIIISQLFWTS